MLQLINPICRGLTKLDGFQKMTALIKNHVQRLTIHGKSERLLRLSDANWHSLCSRGALDRNLQRHIKQSDPASHSLRLLDIQAQQVRARVIRLRDAESRRASTIDPLVEKLVQVHAAGFFKRVNQIFGYH